MTSSTPEPNDSFVRLLDAMPRIAEAVNAFNSAHVQQDAFKALVSIFGVPGAGDGSVGQPDLSVVPPLKGDAGQGNDTSKVSASTRATELKRVESPRRTRKGSAKKTYSRVKDINFRPDGKLSFRDFTAQKEPRSHHEKNAVAVYYLEEILEIDAVTVGHILAAYGECSWKPASDPANSAQVTASTKGWLDTADMNSIKITHMGRNAVEHDMPVQKAKNSA